MFSSRCILAFLILTLSACEKTYDPDEPVEIFTGISDLSTEKTDALDRIVSQYMPHYRYISLGIIRDGVVVLTQSFRDDRLGNADVYASVTKPVTACICMMMLDEGLIGDINDPISQYSKKYADVIPEKYAGSEITFQHLLAHESGIPHHEKIWDGGDLDLAFRPGDGFLYSTRGYGVLGEVLSEISDKSYGDLLEEYIQDPIQATTFSAPGWLFEAPGGLVSSSIEDMASFANGLMEGAYIDSVMRFDLVWKIWAQDRGQPVGLGWYLHNCGTDSLSVYHAGSNGRPRAFIALRPSQKTGLVLQGKNVSPDGDQLFYGLARELMLVLIK